MVIVVDLTNGIVTLVAPDDTDHFAVRVSAPAGATGSSSAGGLARILAATGVGRLDAGGDAFVDPEAVRFRAAGQVDDRWDDRFAAMCRFATTKGWTADDGAIRAHVEWPAGA
ncbi:MAG TPA: hypothetical protein VKG43_09395 [Acidimicrobiales bacterium]|nr:hypothetical protein [Acidimicrobiales bacterium]